MLRDPERVLNDFLCGLVSAEAARTLYGVVLNARGKRVDMEGTSDLRNQLREARRDAAGDGGPGTEASRPGTRALSPSAPGEITATCLGEYLTLRPSSEGKAIVCRVCGEVVCTAAPDFKGRLLYAELLLQAAGPKVDPHGRGEAFSLHAYYCPSCLTQVQVDVALKEEGPIADMQPML